MNTRGRIAWGMLILETAILLGLGALYVMFELLGTTLGQPGQHHLLAYLLLFGYPLALVYVWMSLIRPQSQTSALAILSQAALIGMLLAGALALGWPLPVLLAFAAYPAAAVALLWAGVPDIATERISKAGVLGVIAGLGLWVAIAAGLATAVVFGAIFYVGLRAGFA